MSMSIKLDTGQVFKRQDLVRHVAQILKTADEHTTTPRMLRGLLAARLSVEQASLDEYRDVIKEIIAEVVENQGGEGESINEPAEVNDTTTHPDPDDEPNEFDNPPESDESVNINQNKRKRKKIVDDDESEDDVEEKKRPAPCKATNTNRKPKATNQPPKRKVMTDSDVEIENEEGKEEAIGENESSENDSSSNSHKRKRVKSTQGKRNSTNGVAKRVRQDSNSHLAKLKRLARIVGVSLARPPISRMDESEAIRHLEKIFRKRDIDYSSRALTNEGLERARLKRELMELQPDAELSENDELKETSPINLRRRPQKKKINYAVDSEDSEDDTKLAKFLDIDETELYANNASPPAPKPKLKPRKDEDNIPGLEKDDEIVRPSRKKQKIVEDSDSESNIVMDEFVEESAESEYIPSYSD